LTLTDESPWVRGAFLVGPSDIAAGIADQFDAMLVGERAVAAFGNRSYSMKIAPVSSRRPSIR